MPLTPSTALSSYGSVGIYVKLKDGDAISREPLIARIVPYSATATTLHTFADPGQMRRITGKVYSEANKTTLEGYASGMAVHTLTINGVSQGSFVLMALSFSRAGAQNYSDSWYDVALSLLSQ